MKPKVGYFLNFDGSTTIDCSSILHGNPGIGGSEYEIILIATLLMERGAITPTLYTKHSQSLPANLETKEVSSFETAVTSAINDKMEYLVVDAKRVDNSIIIKYRSQMKFIVWAHNFITNKQLSFLASMPDVVRIVNVGREQLDLYRDHKAFEKSDYIYNAVHVPSDSTLSSLPEFSARQPNVVYIGSLQECKGFHILAKAWKEIVASVPNANLYVIGSGRLYDKTARLGKHGIAESDYENRFMPHLIDANGVLPSVHFLGILGKEKESILMNCRVGVPNPSGESETFGLSAVEMQLTGCSIVTARCPGYLDTVVNKRWLYSHSSQIAVNVVRALLSEVTDYKETCRYIADHFSYDVVASQWEEMLNYGIPCGVFLHDKSIFENGDFRLKRYKEKLRVIKSKCGLLHKLPTIETILKNSIDKYGILGRS